MSTRVRRRIFARRKTKVFCIGANKTGTTSMRDFLTSVGYNVAPQAPAEMMIEDWARRDFTKIISFCRRYEAFQDIPFSLPYTFQSMDQAFPRSKFILTVRASADEWYDSLVRFTRKRLNLVRNPSIEDLRQDNYRYKGFTAHATELIYGNTTPLFDRETYIETYNRHIADVLYYFAFRKSDLLVVNLSEKSAGMALNRFLEVPDGLHVDIPHANSSSQ